MRSKSLQGGIENVRELATKYDKQQLARMAQMGLVGPEDAVMAGLMIDRIAQAAMRPPTTTVAQDVLGPRPQIQQGPQGVAGLQRSPGAPQGPEAAPQGVAGLPSNLPRMAHGGMVAFAGDEGSLVGDPYGNEMTRQAPALPMRGPTPFGPRGSVPVQEFAPPSEVTLQGAMKQQDESQKLAGFDPEFYTKTREEELAKKKESPARKNQAVGDALMMWGAGMLGARQGQEWATASESAKQSLLMYQGAMKEIRDSEKEIDKTARELSVAQNQFLHNKSEKASAKVDAYTSKLADIENKNVEAKNAAAQKSSELFVNLYNHDQQNATSVAVAKIQQATQSKPGETERLYAQFQAILQKEGPAAAGEFLARIEQLKGAGKPQNTLSFEEALKVVNASPAAMGMSTEQKAAEATKLMSLAPQGRAVAGAVPAAEAPGKYSDPNKEKAYQDWLKSQPGK
jgi:hypothetical protein